MSIEITGARPNLERTNVRVYWKQDGSDGFFEISPAALALALPALVSACQEPEKDEASAISTVADFALSVSLAGKGAVLTLDTEAGIRLSFQVSSELCSRLRSELDRAAALRPGTPGIQ